MTDDRNQDEGGSGNGSEVPRYLGPYEAWNFGDGRGYALPVLRKYSRYYTALAELGAVPGDLPNPEPGTGFFPKLWEDVPRRFIPFVVERPFGRHPVPLTTEDLTMMLQSGFVSAFSQFFPSLLFRSDNLEERSPRIGFLRRAKQSRFRVAFPVARKAMHKRIGTYPKPPPWCPDEKLRERIGEQKEITVIAVIDDGVPFAHRNFRDGSGKRSRIEFCWLQSVAIDKNQKSVMFGREYIRDEIENLIAQYGDDEDTLYRVAGATEDTEELGSLIDRHATHGAHVMDLATGYEPGRGQVPPDEIRIIAVQLPNTIAWDTSGFGKDMYMLSAFHYIFDRADILAEAYCVENLRLVINFSYGFSGGRHDGETELEAAIDELIEARRCRKKTEAHPLLGPSPTALILPAGNTFLDRLHGLICPEDFHDNAATFYWRIQPNDRTTSYLELWFWKDFNPHGYVIELYDPSGEQRADFTIEVPDQMQAPGDPHTMKPLQNDGHEPIGQISVDLHRADPDAQKDTGRYRVLIVVAPTEPENSSLPHAEAGKWKVVIKRGVRLIDQPIHCWIQRSADPESLRSGSRQSYFDHGAFEKTRFTPEGDFAETDTKVFVRRFGSLNGLATGKTALVIGGYRLGAGLRLNLAKARPSRYSSAGVLQSQLCDPSLVEKEVRAASWPEKQVGASSMSDRSRVLPGTIAAGVRSGSLSLVQGTSVAAPFVARRLAEVFAQKEKDIPAEPDDNYLYLLSDDESGIGKAASPPGQGTSCGRKDDPELIKARLGEILVPPHRQPGIES